MRKWLQKYKFVVILFVVWRIILLDIAIIAPLVVPLHLGYLGPTPWANMDGVHYLRIAGIEYFPYTEAFFPFYPIAMRVLATLFHVTLDTAGVIISNTAFFAGLMLLYRMLYKQSESIARWTLISIITFPTAFFFAAVYTEGLFFLLSIACIALAREKKWVAAGACGALASATRFIGICLFIPLIWEYWKSKPKRIIWRDVLGILSVALGLLSYMLFLYLKSGDPLKFIHVLPAFGSNRSGGDIILLPQVVWRYCKIIFTAFWQPNPVSYVVSVVEFVLTAGAYSLLYFGWKAKFNIGYLLYAFVAITVPTLTGTLTSMPRYLLTVFPLCMLLGRIRTRWVKYSMIVFFCILQTMGAMLYLRGWFVS